MPDESSTEKPINMNQILIGNALDILKTLPDQLVQMCVTSPPYFHLRDYGVEPIIWDAQAGCEHEWTNEKFLHTGGAHGNNSTLKQGNRSIVVAQAAVKIISSGKFCKFCGAWLGCLGLEPTVELYIKHLVDIFREVKRVLKDDGILWVNIGDSHNGSGKAGSNPEYQERHTAFGQPMEQERHGIPTNLANLKPKDLIGIPWELAFALRDDGWTLRRDIIWEKNAVPENVKDRPTGTHEYIFLLSKNRYYYYDYKAILEEAKWERWGNQTVKKDQQGASNWIGDKSKEELQQKGWRNKRSIWKVATASYAGSHFAVFPPDLIEPCVLAGSRENDIVLDPFGGSGTTGSVAKKLKRDYILIDIQPEYKKLMDKRISDTQEPLFGDFGRPNDEPEEIFNWENGVFSNV